MTRAADPTSVLCKRYSMYEPGKRVARGWNARWRRTWSGESRDTVQRRYKERRRGRMKGEDLGGDREKEGEGEGRRKERRGPRRNVGVARVKMR